jgi:DNA primase
MLSPTEEIKARLNIVDVVGSYVKLDKSGSHWKACCPFHRERSPSFMVNEERQMWHCFGCNKGGDAFAFVMEMEGIGFREALVMLAERANVELPQYSQAAQEQYQEARDEKDRLYEIHELATKFYEKQLWEGPGKELILGYLRDRGLTEESIRTFRLGFAPEGWRHLYDFLIKSGFDAKELVQAGIALKKENGDGYYDRFRDRIMFPITDTIGRVIGYSARVRPGADESQAKYINTSETPIYKKSQVLYGLAQARQAIKQAGYAVLVEGNMDVIACHQAGIENTVAVSGTALTEEQLALLRRYGKEIRFFFDMDEAGQKAARRSTELALGQDIEALIISIPEGKDAADVAREHPDTLREAIAHPQPALQYFLAQLVSRHDIETPAGQKEILAQFVPFVAVAKNEIDRAYWIKELAQAIRVEEKHLYGVIHTARVEREKRVQHLPNTDRNAFQETATLYTKRSERLREEMIGLMLAFATVRACGRELVDEVVLKYLEKHPLYFFIVQAGDERNPIDLVEDKDLKALAGKLLFRILDGPDFSVLSEEERGPVAGALFDRLVVDMKKEVIRSEELVALEHALEAARRAGEKEKEKELLSKFMLLSRENQ